MTVLLQSNVTWSSAAYSSYHPSSVYSDLPFQDPTRTVLLSFLLHFALFYLIPVPSSLLPPSTIPTRTSTPLPSTSITRNYLVSTFHATVVILSILAWVATYAIDLRSLPRGIGGGLAGTGDEWHSTLIAFSLGYFAYDTACMLLHPRTASTSAFLHHAVVGLSFLLGLLFHCCRPFHFLLLLEELSTPALNLKTLLRHSRPAWSEACALLFAVTFIGVRMGYGVYVYLYAVQQLLPFVKRAGEDGEQLQVFCAYFQFAMCTASRLLNVYWTWLIVRKVLKAVGGGKKGGGKKSRKGGDLAHRVEKEAATGGSDLTTNTAGGDKLD